MTGVERVLEDAETTRAVRRLVEYRCGRGATPWPSDFVNAVEQTGDLCLRRTTTAGFCTFSYRRGRWWCSEYDRALDRTLGGRVSRETVLDWVAGTPPELVVCEKSVGDSARGSADGSPGGSPSSSAGSSVDESMSANAETTRPDGGRADARDETDIVATRVELESVVGSMTRIDWSIVPDVPAIEAAAWSARLVEARDSLASEPEFVTGETLEASPTN